MTTTTYRLSGLNQTSLKYYPTPKDKEERAFAQKIHNSIKEFALNFSKWSQTKLSLKLEEVSNNALDTATAVTSGIPVDTQGQLIDRITQHDELLQLAGDLEKITLIAELSIKMAFPNQDHTCNAQSWCDALNVRSKYLQTLAANLQGQMDHDARVLTDELASTTNALPKDVLGIIAKYLMA
jgi:hypothetical protein